MKLSLRALRHNSGLTANKVAKIISVSPNTLRNYENGNSEPSFSTVIKLSNIYKVDINQIKMQEEKRG